MKNDRINRYTGQVKRSTANLVDYAPSPNPYVAIVRNHLDFGYLGGLEVQLLPKTASGNPPDDPGSYFKVRYLAPFYGVTPLAGVQANDGHQNSQKSYGMWFTPPDVGSKVLVIFAEGGEAFWIGCIPEKDTNFMMPAGDVATTYHKDDTQQDKKLPVGELNKLTDPNQSGNATKIIKPVNDDILSSLVERGLLEDETRGITTSSARRETPSSVFGISTPGPYDRRDDAPKVKYGNTQVYHNRLGGSSIVMDDGDATLLRKSPASTGPSEYADIKKDETDGDVTIPHNEMLRLKTRTGHQILMHNSEDLIYIGNSKGTTWIELTSNGKIDIYAKDSVSVHTETDLNFRADRDVNIEAGRNVNLKAAKTYNGESGGNINFEAVENYRLFVGKDNTITTEGKLDISTKKDNKITSQEENTEINSDQDNNFTAVNGSTNILSGGQHIETASKIHMNGPSASAASKSESAQPLKTWGLPLMPKTIMRRVPQAEPWIHHENLGPQNFAPRETDVKKDTDEGPKAGEYIPTADTFRRGADRGG